MPSHTHFGTKNLAKHLHLNWRANEATQVLTDIYSLLEIMASTSNDENFMKIARIVYQLCDYTHFRADFLQTRICSECVGYAERGTDIKIL